MTRDYTTSWEQISLHYGEAYSLAELVSQLASNSTLEYTSHQTPNIKYQTQFEFSQRQSIYPPH